MVTSTNMHAMVRRFLFVICVMILFQAKVIKAASGEYATCYGGCRIICYTVGPEKLNHHPNFINAPGARGPNICRNGCIGLCARFYASPAF